MELNLQNKKALKKELLEKDSLIHKKVAILSGSTIGEVVKILELYLLHQGIIPEFWVGDYDRYYEDAVFENDSLKTFGPDIIYIHTTNKNIQTYPGIGDSEEKNLEIIEIEYQRFEQIWSSLKERYHCPIIQNNFEPLHYRVMGNADSYRLNGKQRYINDLNKKIYDYANRTEDFYINDINYLAAYCGITKWFDESKWYLYKYALNPEAIPLLCQSISSIIKALFGKNKKALVLDLDNTLWGGVIGDDGVENIQLGEESPQGRAYKDFQLYLKDLSKIGVLLNVCSKNEYELAIAGFNHNSSVLSLSDFIAFEANWEHKNINIEKIASQINLNCDSMVFVDDNPAEREIVKLGIPNISVPEVLEPEKYISTIDKEGYFEVTNLTADDLRRKDYYQVNEKRKTASNNFDDYNAYLKSLEMKAEIHEFKIENIERVTQLINKTNQFNFTTKRYTKPEIEILQDSKEIITLQASLQDKYGDNGIVSAIIAETDNDAATINLWVMSCRVFKRNLEYAIVDQLIYECQKRGIKSIYGQYIPSSKNAIIKDLYKDLEFTCVDEHNETTKWEYKIPTNYKPRNNVIGVK